MNESRIALTHAGSIATEAILEKLPESGLAPDSLVLLGDESIAGTRLGYADSFLEVRNQHEYEYDDCALVLMPNADEIIVDRLSHLDAVLVSHHVAGSEPVIYAASRDAEISFSYTQSTVRVCTPELACLMGVLPTLHSEFDIQGLNMAFVQSAECRGKAAIDELAGQTVSLLNAREAESDVYPLQIAFNMIPATAIQYLNTDLPSLLGNCDISCIHQVIDVPAFHGFAAAIQLEFSAGVELQQIETVLGGVENTQLSTNPVSPISDCNQSFSCVINHLEQAQNQPNCIHFWMIADPMRYGLANNYVNVTDILLKSFL